MSDPNSSNNRVFDQTRSGRSLDFRALVQVLLERVWILALCLVIGILVSVYKAQKEPRLFAAHATIMVEQGEQKVVNIQKVQAEDLRGIEVLRTIEQLLLSPVLLERVIEANNLDKNPAFVRLDGPPRTTAQLVSTLSGMLDIKLRRFTRLIDVRCVHTDPGIAALVANSVVNEYMKLNVEQYNASSEVANQFLVDEAQRLKKKLEASENALQAYRELSKTVSLEQRQDIVTQKLKELSARLTDAKSARITSEAELAQVKELGTNVTALLVLSVVARDPQVVAAHSSLNASEAEFANLTSRYKSKHPKYIQALSQLNELREKFTNSVLKVGQTAQASFESAKAAEKTLEQAVRDQEALAIDLNKQAIQYNVLAREVESDRTLYASIMHRLKETSLARELPSNIMRLVQPANPPERPFSPDKQRMILMGALAGLLAGIGLIWFLHTVDSSIKTVDQAEEALGLSVLSAIPQVSEAARKDSTLILANDAKSMGAEAFRSLRTSIRMLGHEQDRRTFLFTSAVPQEGKTFCSTNFALCLAQQGLRTLLIDGDLRRPAVEAALTKERGKRRGVTDYLTGQAKLNDIIFETGHKDFSFIPAGTTAPNPAELLAGGHFDALIAEALQTFDRVIVDSAPINAVSDTLVMLSKIQTVCLVVRSGKTSQKAVQRSVFLLRQAEASLGGVILNRMKVGKLAGYYSPYYDYSYKGSYSSKGVYGA